MTRPIYPHLLPADAQVWHVFHELEAKNFTRFQYDVSVGRGRPAPEDSTEAIVKMTEFLSRRRIDVVGFQPDLITIFEVTHTLGFTAIGQWLAYPALYQLTFSPTLPIRAVIVTQSIETDLPALLKVYEIPVFVVDTAKSSMATLTHLIDTGADIPGP